jgi:hypothetical protein
MSTTIKLRRGTLSQWNTNNSVVLASGEPALEIDTGRLKIGNGSLAWSGLPYSFILPTGFQAGTNIGLNYNSANNTLTISATGSSGGSGSQGTQGIQGIQGSKIIWRGTWDIGISYNVDDIVYVEGSSYICIISHTSAIFSNDSANWQLFSKSGSQGTNGSNGIQGLQGFSIQGSVGAQGIQGASGGGGVGDGAQGTQGIQGIQGLSVQGIQGLHGSQGTNGIQGIQGIYGPVAGFPNQIIYKNSSNIALGSNTLLFDGTKLISASGLFNQNLTVGKFEFLPNNGLETSFRIYTDENSDNSNLVNVSNEESTLFNIKNNMSGSLFSVNNIGGIPVFEVLSNSMTRIGRYNQNDLIVNSSGNIGIGTNNPAYKLQVNGSFGAKTKSFRINHPSKNGYILEYGSLESPYHGVRLTGRGIIKNGYCKIELPYYLKDLIINDESINIQLSNLNHSKNIYVSKIDLENCNFEVGCGRCKNLKELNFFWTFTGIRKDTTPLITEQKGNL